MADPIVVMSAEQLRELVACAVAEAMPNQAEKPMTREQAAAWLQCSTRTIDNMIADGAPCVRLGGRGGSPRFVTDRLIAWLESRGEQIPEGPYQGMRRDGG